MQVKNSYDKNFKKKKKEIEDTGRWKALPCSWIGRSNTVKSGRPTKSSLQTQCSLHRNSTQFFTDLERTVFDFIWKHKNPWSLKQSWSMKRAARGITVPYFKLYYSALVTKTAWYCHKNRHVQWNQIEDPDINPPMYGHLIFYIKKKYTGKRQHLQQVVQLKLAGRR